MSYFLLIIAFIYVLILCCSKDVSNTAAVGKFCKFDIILFFWLPLPIYFNFFPSFWKSWKHIAGYLFCYLSKWDTERIFMYSPISWSWPNYEDSRFWETCNCEKESLHGVWCLWKFLSPGFSGNQASLTLSLSFKLVESKSDRVARKCSVKI